eukprot:gene40987-3722_t
MCAAVDKKKRKGRLQGGGAAAAAPRLWGLLLGLW